MKILVIEDDKNKLKQVRNFLEENIEECSILEKYSYNSGLKEVISKTYDLLLLDMSMPTFDITNEEKGGRPKPFAGKEILRKMKRKRIAVPTIVITQFETFGDMENSISFNELDIELSKQYSNYISAIFYSSSEKQWEQELLKSIKGVINEKNKHTDCGR